MANSGVDTDRRRFLVTTTSVVGALGAVAMVAPFINSMNPSARALAAGAPVEFDVSKVEPGQLLRVIWQGKPVWVVNRTKEMLDALPSLNDRLKDPDSTLFALEPKEREYARNPHRSINPQYLVLIGICTHLGCSPTFRPELAPADLGADWKGGWYCPCHGSRFDLAGRVFKNVPAGANLQVPPYYFKDDKTILIGKEKGEA